MHAAPGRRLGKESTEAVIALRFWDGFVSHVHCFSMNVCSDDLFQMMVYMMISHCLPSLDLQDEQCCSNQSRIPTLHSPCRRSPALLFGIAYPSVSRNNHPSLLCRVPESRQENEFVYAAPSLHLQVRMHGLANRVHAPLSDMIPYLCQNRNRSGCCQ